MREQLNRIPTKQDWIGPLVAILVALVSLAVSGYSNYNRNDKQNEHRITIIETQQKNDGDRLDRMEHKLDLLLERVTR